MMNSPQNTFQRLAVASLNQTPLDLVGNVARIREAIRLAANDGATVMVLPCDSVIGFGAQRHRFRSDISSEVKLLKNQLAATAPLRIVFSEDGDTHLGDIILRTEQTPIPFLISKSLPSVLQIPSLIRARENDVVAYAAPSGCAEGRFLYDGVSWIAVRGVRLVATTPFSFEDVTVVTADITTQTTTPITAPASVHGIFTSFPNFRHPRVLGGGLDNTLQADAIATFAQANPTALALDSRLRGNDGHGIYCEQLLASPSANTDKPDTVLFTAFSQAISFGLYDYLRKSGARQFVVSLSGGADSTAVAMLVHLAVIFGTDELGSRRFAKQLGLDVSDTATPREITGLLLRCIYQATVNSSDTTRNAAREVVAMVGARYDEVDVQPIVDLYIKKASSVLGRELDWSRDSASLQNIQARARSPLAWMLANVESGLLLCTSNRSEATVGYCTMDGDTSGGLAPLGGIDKAFLRQYLCWLQDDGIVVGETLHRFEKLACVNDQQPTAELLPPAARQTDEGDLMPYTLLNLLERWIVGESLSPREAALRLADHELNAAWVAKFMRLWQKNQWKRHRYALHFAIDADAPPDDLLDDYPTLVRESHALTVAILGAGLMGRAIAAALTQAGFAVTLHDIGASIDELCAASVIIETIVEKTSAKKKVYRELANFRGILLTNTSTIPIATLSTAAPDPSRFCGLHFFHPVAERPLVEIIPGPVTSPATIAFAASLAAALGKEAIRVADHAGFLVNRLLHPYLSEALALAESAESISAKDETIYNLIDAAAVEFGMAKGPFTLMDEIGLDVVWHGGFILYKAFPNRVRISITLETLVREGRLGVKAGQGFYTYPRREETIISTVSSLPSREEIATRLITAMAAEAVRCYDDVTIDDLALADTASVKGLGFPVSLGGVVTWGRSQNIIARDF